LRGLVNALPGQDLALLLKQEGTAVFSADLSTSEGDGTVVIALYGELRRWSMRVGTPGKPAVTWC